VYVVGYPRGKELGGAEGGLCAGVHYGLLVRGRGGGAVSVERCARGNRSGEAKGGFMWRVHSGL